MYSWKDIRDAKVITAVLLTHPVERIFGSLPKGR
jgi:hypothetical protein